MFTDQNLFVFIRGPKRFCDRPPALSSSLKTRYRKGPAMPISRRKMFTKGAAAAAAGSLAFIPQAVKGQAPAQLTGTNAGRRFKAFVRHGAGASVEELRLHAIQPREVL